MIEGRWTTEWYQPDAQGRFVRPPTQFRGRVAAGEVTAGRYHLYVCLACPWAHRTLLARELLGLHDLLGVSLVHPDMLENGWELRDDAGASTDPVLGKRYLWEVYREARADYTGRVTVPVLWDREAGTIVSNESREILRMLSTTFARAAGAQLELAPEALLPEIDAMIDANYEPINNGVYRSGFATSQQAYEEAVGQLFERLGELEALLAGQRYLVGEQLTEADLCLWTTLVRFDAVYHGHFKCNRRRIQDYPALWGYLRDLYQRPAFRETTDLPAIKRHYYYSHESLNPSRVVPVGPELDLDGPHGREAM
ncbi:MAG: glutathione S-transferase family protein [Deltaproteobacteria bacterium]|nr:glutathione S-transferase family protein [Deltaproteobacteria bacterium]